MKKATARASGADDVLGALLWEDAWLQFHTLYNPLAKNHWAPQRRGEWTCISQRSIGPQGSHFSGVGGFLRKTFHGFPDGILPFSERAIHLKSLIATTDPTGLLYILPNINHSWFGGSYHTPDAPWIEDLPKFTIVFHGTYGVCLFPCGIRHQPFMVNCFRYISSTFPMFS